MNFKWVLVFAIIVWFLYVSLSPYAHDIWTRYNLHVKFALCVLFCATILLLPSPSAFLQKHQGFIRDVWNHLAGGNATKPPASEVARVLEGSQLARPPPAPPRQEGGGAAHTLPPLTDIEKRTVAAVQKWQCMQCRTPLSVGYRVYRSNSVNAHAVCERCFSKRALLLHPH